MTCREAIEVLADFLDATLNRDAGAALDAHLQECEECRAYLATYRRTIGGVAGAARVDMPRAMRDRVRMFLLDRLQEGHR